MPADSMMAANNTETSARSLPAALYYVTSIAGSCGRAVLAPFLGQSGPIETSDVWPLSGGRGIGQRVPNRD